MSNKASRAATCCFSVFLALAGAREAHADERCVTVSLAADPQVRALWPELPGRVRAHLEERSDVERCAHIRLGHRGRFLIEVTLPDGRVAERSVSRVEDVVPVVEALLVVPATIPDPEAREVEPPPPPRAPGQVIVANVAPAADRVDTIAPVETRPGTPSEHRTSIEISAVTGARVGVAGVDRASIGAGLLSFARVDGFLVGLGGRVDRYEMISQPTTVVELAGLLGYRFRWSDTTLDLVGGPALIVIGTEVRDVGRDEVVRPAGTAPPPERSPFMPRLVTGLRLHFRARSTFRPFVGIDGEVGPSGVSLNPTQRDAPLPYATLGLALGATLGSR